MDLGLLDLVVEGLLQVQLVAGGELVEVGAVELVSLEVHGRYYLPMSEKYDLGWNRSCMRLQGGVDSKTSLNSIFEARVRVALTL